MTVSKQRIALATAFFAAMLSLPAAFATDNDKGGGARGQPGASFNADALKSGKGSAARSQSAPAASREAGRSQSGQGGGNDQQPQLAQQPSQGLGGGGGFEISTAMEGGGGMDIGALQTNTVIAGSLSNAVSAPAGSDQPRALR